MRPFKEFLLEFNAVDYQDSISPETAKHAADRKHKLGAEISHLKFKHSQFFDDLGLMLTFTTTPTNGVGECYDIGTGKFYEDSVYTMKILYPKYAEEEFPDDIKGNFVMQEDIKFICNCRSFHWQGFNKHASDLEGSITSTDIPDNYWKFFHKGKGAICKHLHGLFKELPSYQQRILLSARKAKLAAGQQPTEES